MKLSKEILEQQDVEDKKARRKERIYLACGFVTAAIAGYGADKLASNIEDGICEILHNDFGYPKLFYNSFILCGAVNKEPFFTTAMIVFAIVSAFAIKAVDAMRKERQARQLKIWGEQLQREIQAEKTVASPRSQPPGNDDDNPFVWRGF